MVQIIHYDWIIVGFKFHGKSTALQGGFDSCKNINFSWVNTSELVDIDS